MGGLKLSSALLIMLCGHSPETLVILITGPIYIVEFVVYELLEDVFFYRTHFPAQALAFIVLLCHVFIAFVKAVGLFAYIITQCTHTACALHGCLQSISIWLLAIDLYAGL